MSSSSNRGSLDWKIDPRNIIQTGAHGDEKGLKAGLAIVARGNVLPLPWDTYEIDGTKLSEVTLSIAAHAVVACTTGEGQRAFVETACAFE
jgi:hypothetical protein